MLPVCAVLVYAALSSLVVCGLNATSVCGAESALLRVCEPMLCVETGFVSAYGYALVQYS